MSIYFLPKYFFTGLAETHTTRSPPKDELISAQGCIGYKSFGEANGMYGKSNCGKANGMYGKKHSKETKKKYSRDRSGEGHNMYGKHHSKQTKEKIRQSKIGKKLTEEHVEKIRQKAIGRKQPQSQKDKVAAALSKGYIITTPDGDKFQIVNLRQWCKENGIDQGNMARVAKGKAKQHKGFKICYK